MTGNPYLLLIGIAIQLVLMTRVYYLAPKRTTNRLFAIYMLDLALASSAVLIQATTSDPQMAFASMIAYWLCNSALSLEENTPI